MSIIPVTGWCSDLWKIPEGCKTEIKIAMKTPPEPLHEQKFCLESKISSRDVLRAQMAAAEENRTQK